MFYAHLFEGLERHGVRYAVAGGLAVNLHGVPRTTADVDLVVDLNPDNLKNFLDVMQELGFRPKLPLKAEELLSEEERRDWIEHRNLHAFTFWNEQRPFEEIDLLLTVSDDMGILERAQVVIAGNLKIYLSSIDDLIKMKQCVNRLQDKADIEALEQLKQLEIQ